MKFFYKSSGIAVSTMVFAAVGFDVMAQNVGVGTSTPAEKVHVIGSVRSSALAGAGNREVLADPNGTLIIGNGAIAPDWTLLGNANAATGTNFLGTTNAIRLDFRTNSVIRQSTLPTGEVYLNDAVGVNNALFTSYAGAPTTTNIGVDGQASSIGVLGIGGGAGVQGQTNSANDGVFGINTNAGNSGAATGVYGLNLGAAGVGTTGDGFTGVLGLNAGGTYYVAGVAGLSAGLAVSGHATAASGTGGFFRASGASPQPFGLFGDASNAGAADAVGVFGNTENGDAYGVVGTALGGTYYVLGVGYGTGGFADRIGVYGVSNEVGNNPGNPGRAGGYFVDNASGAFAYVGTRINTTNYKIAGAGAMSTIVEDVNNQSVIMFAPEAPEVFFQDYGHSQLTAGLGHVDLDPTFAKNTTVDNDHQLKVFIQLEGDCKGVYVTNKSATGFDIVELEGGQSNAAFTWFATANRADDPTSEYENLRFPPGPDLNPEVHMKNANEKIKNIKTGTSINAEKSGRVPLKEGETPSE